MGLDSKLSVKVDKELEERLLNLSLKREELSQNEIEIEEYLILNALVKSKSDNLETLFIQGFLLKALASEDPFPTLKQKGKAGRKPKINFIECAFLLNKTKSVNRTSEILNVSRKAIRQHFDETNRDDIKNSCGMWEIFQRLYSKEMSEYKEKYKNI